MYFCFHFLALFGPLQRLTVIHRLSILRLVWDQWFEFFRLVDFQPHLPEFRHFLKLVSQLWSLFWKLYSHLLLVSNSNLRQANIYIACWVLERGCSFWEWSPIYQVPRTYDSLIHKLFHLLDKTRPKRDPMLVDSKIGSNIFSNFCTKYPKFHNIDPSSLTFRTSRDTRFCFLRCIHLDISLNLFALTVFLNPLNLVIWPKFTPKRSNSEIGRSVDRALICTFVARIYIYNYL